jgi:hypothetical protein
MVQRCIQAALVLGLLSFASAAHAGWIIEGSVGKGARVSPSPAQATQTNVMIAPGFTVPFLRFEVGLLNELPDLKDSKYNIEVRPMIVVAPPILPLYGRAIFAFTNLLHGDTHFAWGAAGGVKIGIGPVGVFAEAGFLPRSIASTINWVIEGRLGAWIGF